MSNPNLPHPTGSDHPRWKGGKAARLKRRRAKQKADNPAAFAAHQAVNLAKLAGRLVPLPCVVCGTIFDIQAHHEDYGKPLEVVWLCRNCHRKHHGQ